MKLNFQATPAGEAVSNDLGIEKALTYWQNEEALNLLKNIVKGELPPQKFDISLLMGLIERGFVEFSSIAVDNPSELFTTMI
ncbi:hypothetical protein C7H19_15150 [Aphanothece hegewaldii CCALA 016]|uniref:Uncharacterized protein n=1 Tax=Aphanothece hegewaldii CCALA 016 TaxID=2107694 RepID=A0A2T1LVK2_9CHRO|nr:hypothetical protein [Aphanothece hegewaldii]PSF35761.1 hypothetical protein C7H19_15150 [Aphanothece hegewaldii CCALA 016]